MNLLIIGSGAREHAIAWRQHERSGVDAQLREPGNASSAAIGIAAPYVEASPLDMGAIMWYVVAAYNNMPRSCHGRGARGSHYGQ